MATRKKERGRPGNPGAPDITQHFSRIKSRYFIGLIDALRVLRPNQFVEAMFEHEFTMEPRGASEISDAVEELEDRIWYDRHMVGHYKIQAGKTKIIAEKDFGPQHYRESANSKLWVGQELCDIALGDRQMQYVQAVTVFDRFHLALQAGQLSLHAGDLSYVMARCL